MKSGKGAAGMNCGRLIVLEGIEGVGKSTQVSFLAGWLEEQGFPVTLAREPGGTVLGERLRDILLDPQVTDLPAQAELLLMFAARSASLEEIILPALAKGSWVISDRFVDSSYAYQSYGRGLPLKHVEQLHAQVLGDLKPDMTVILDAPVSVGLARIGGPESGDRFEREGSEFFGRVRNGYLERAKTGGNRYRIVDASQSVLEVRRALLKEVQELMAAQSVPSIK